MSKDIAIVLFFIRLFSSVIFGILYSSLVLFLIQNLHTPTGIAVSIVGIFLALHYSLALVNGMIVGRWISNINAMILGIIIQGVSIILIFRGGYDVLFGCALFLIGSLASSTPINMMITERYEANDPARERYFMWGYAAMNLGNMLGFTIAGYFQIINNFKNLDIIANIFMMIALLLCFVYREKLKDLHSTYARLNIAKKITGTIIYVLVLAFLTFIVKVMLVYSEISSFMLIFTVSAALMGILAYNCLINYKNGLIFISLALASLIFWSIYFLIPTGLTIFANYNTNRMMWGFLIPPAWLPNINSILIILGAPLIGVVLKRIDKDNKCTVNNKFLVGLISLSCAFLLLIQGIVSARYHLVALHWVVLSYVLLTFSELLIAPVSFAAIGKYVDRDKQNIMTGALIAILGLGGLLASKFSNFVKISGNNIVQTNIQFLKLFTVLFLVTICLGIILYLAKKFMNINS